MKVSVGRLTETQSLSLLNEPHALGDPRSAFAARMQGGHGLPLPALPQLPSFVVLISTSVGVIFSSFCYLVRTFMRTKHETPPVGEPVEMDKQWQNSHHHGKLSPRGPESCNRGTAGIIFHHGKVWIPNRKQTTVSCLLPRMIRCNQ